MCALSFRQERFAALYSPYFALALPLATRTLVSFSSAHKLLPLGYTAVTSDAVASAPINATTASAGVPVAASTCSTAPVFLAKRRSIARMGASPGISIGPGGASPSAVRAVPTGTVGGLIATRVSSDGGSEEAAATAAAAAVRTALLAALRFITRGLEQHRAAPAASIEAIVALQCPLATVLTASAAAAAAAAAATGSAVNSSESMPEWTAVVAPSADVEKAAACALRALATAGGIECVKVGLSCTALQLFILVFEIGVGRLSIIAYALRQRWMCLLFMCNPY